MIAELELLSVAAVATLLALKLGPDRQWVDMLNGHRRSGKSAIGGNLLLPFGRKQNPSGTINAPCYHPAHVGQFIVNVRAACGLSKPFPYVAKRFTFVDDPLLSADLWHFRILIPV